MSKHVHDPHEASRSARRRAPPGLARTRDELFRLQPRPVHQPGHVDRRAHDQASRHRAHPDDPARPQLGIEKQATEEADRTRSRSKKTTKIMSEEVMTDNHRLSDDRGVAPYDHRHGHVDQDGQDRGRHA